MHRVHDKHGLDGWPLLSGHIYLLVGGGDGGSGHGHFHAFLQFLLSLSTGKGARYIHRYSFKTCHSSGALPEPRRRHPPHPHKLRVQHAVLACVREAPFARVGACCAIRCALNRHTRHYSLPCHAFACPNISAHCSRHVSSHEAVLAVEMPLPSSRNPTASAE